MSSRSRASSSARRSRSRSPRQKKYFPPGPPRRRGLLRGKRPASYEDHVSERTPKKRQRSPRSRLHSGAGSDEYVVDRPLFRGPEENLNCIDRESLKKIVVKMRDTPTGSDTIKREIVNPEEINVVRRAAAYGGRLHYYEVNNNRMSDHMKIEPEWEHQLEDRNGLYQYTSEGSRPIFDREEIVNYGRKFEEGDRDRKPVISRSPVHSGQRHSSSERFRSREPYHDDRSRSSREYSRGRPRRDYDSRSYDRSKDERPRYTSSRRSRSHDGERDYSRDRHDERGSHRSFRRSPERGRSDGRLRRRPSPRRRVDDHRPDRERRDIDSGHYRDREHVPVDEYSEYPPESHGYYEGEITESRMVSPSRGRGLSLRRRGVPAARVFPRPGEIIMHPAPPVRGAFLPRLPGRRLPFPPRLVRPLVGPVIRVIAPVIPVRPPVLPVRPPPVIPVRHPVIPLPY